MKLYFACTNIEQIEYLVEKWNAKNILFSFAYLKSEKDIKRLYKYRNLNILVDSGAFTAWTKGREVNIDEYVDYLKGFILPLEDLHSVNIINLDVIPAKVGQKPNKIDIEHSAVKGFENYLYIKSRGIETIHTYHQHEEVKYLEQLKKYCKYVGISPANDLSPQKRIAWLKSVFYNIKTDVRAHILGFTAESMLRQIPCYSADSIEWQTGVMFGNATGVKDKRLSKFITRSSRKSAWDNNIKNYLKKEDYITKLWETRKIKW